MAAKEFAGGIDGTMTRTPLANVIFAAKSTLAVCGQVTQAVGEEGQTCVTTSESKSVKPVDQLNFEHREVILLFIRCERPVPPLSK